jgi:hypothetical protein
MSASSFLYTQQTEALYVRSLPECAWNWALSDGCKIPVPNLWTPPRKRMTSIANSDLRQSQCDRQGEVVGRHHGTVDLGLHRMNGAPRKDPIDGAPRFQE